MQTNNENALKASYIVSYRKTQNDEAHTTAKNCIKSCLIGIATCMFDESAKYLNTTNVKNQPNICPQFLCHTILLSVELQSLILIKEKTLVSRIKFRKFDL